MISLDYIYFPNPIQVIAVLNCQNELSRERKVASEKMHFEQFVSKEVLEAGFPLANIFVRSDFFLLSQPN